MSVIARTGRWGPVPDIFAFVDPHNEGSCKMFERNGFEVLQEADPNEPEADCLYWRPEGGGSEKPTTS